MLNIMIARNIRRLRLEQGLTQEELAERLGVTGQAVSKWERGESCPDIQLLPGLANLFGVTLDELVGMEELRGWEKMQGVYAQVSDLTRQGRYIEAVELLEQARTIFPSEDGMLSAQAELLAMIGGQENIRLAIGLAERALKGDMREKPRATARALLCFLYRMAGDIEKARALAKNLPHVRENREFLYPQFLDPAERAEYLRANLPGIKRMIDELETGELLSDAEWIRRLVVGE